MATFDAHANFGLSAVVNPPSPATTGTSLTVSPGTVSSFPAVPFNATVWPGSGANLFPTAANAEIVRVTAIAGSTLTIVRQQEGSAQQAIGVGWMIGNAITAKTLSDIQTAALAVGNTTHSIAINTNLSGSQFVLLDNRNGVAVGSSPFATADAALAALETILAGSLGSVSIRASVGGTHSIANNHTTPTNLAVKVESGAQFAISAGKLLTFNGPVDFPNHQIFTGSGNWALGKGATVIANPVWAGYDVTGTSDCGPSINATLAAINGNYGASPNSNTFSPTAILKMPAGTGKIATEVIAESWQGLEFAGAGPGQTRLIPALGSAGVLLDFNGISGCLIHGFSIENGTALTNALQYRYENDAGGHLPQRSSTQNIFELISLYNSEWQVGLAIGTGNSDNQCDGTTYRKIRANGGWNTSGTSASGLYAAGIALGATPPNHGVAGNNYNHAFYDCCVTACQWGVYCDGSAFWWFGGEMANCGVQIAPNVNQFSVSQSGSGGTVPANTYYIYAIYQYGTGFYSNYTLLSTQTTTGSASTITVVWNTGSLPASCTNVTIAMFTSPLPLYGTTPWIQGTLTAPGTLNITSYANSTQVTMAAGATFGIGVATNSTILISGCVDQDSGRFLQRVPSTGSTLTMQVSVRDSQWSNALGGLTWDNWIICCNAWCGDLFLENFRVAGGASEPTAAGILFEGEGSPYTATIHLDGIQAQTTPAAFLSLANNADAVWGTYKQLSVNGQPRSDTGTIFNPRNSGPVNFGSGGATADYQHTVYDCTASGTLTLPPSAGCPPGASYELLVVCSGTATATIARQGSDVIQLAGGSGSATSTTTTTFARFRLLGGFSAWLQC